MNEFHSPTPNSDNELGSDSLESYNLSAQEFQPQQFLVLVVDDAVGNLNLVGRILEQGNYETTFASHGVQALEQIPMVQPDLIVLDLIMPDISGLEVCRKLKENPKTNNIPVIFLTASDNKKDLVEAFAYGAVDYITKPFSAPELLARVKNHLELKHSRDLLKQAIAKLERLAKTDPLTGIANRRHWLTLANQEFKRAQRYESSFSILLIDLDHFKSVNDTYGHHAGDQVLVTTVKAIKSKLRQQDFFGRWGGEEFVVLLPETRLKSAETVAERLRATIEDLVKTPPEDQVYPYTTLSVGITSCGAKDINLDSIIQRADQALYQAKERGRNQGVVIAPHGLEHLLRNNNGSDR
ncbi:MAG: diguanylate cyclase [Cyanobacteria bacterium P01_C01_bin.89]